MIAFASRAHFMGVQPFILELVRVVLARFLGVHAREVLPDRRLRADLGLSRFEAALALIRVEEAVGVELPASLVDDDPTVAALAQTAHARLERLSDDERPTLPMVEPRARPTAGIEDEAPFGLVRRVRRRHVSAWLVAGVLLTAGAVAAVVHQADGPAAHAAVR